MAQQPHRCSVVAAGVAQHDGRRAAVAAADGVLDGHLQRRVSIIRMCSRHLHGFAAYERAAVTLGCLWAKPRL